MVYSRNHQHNRRFQYRFQHQLCHHKHSNQLRFSIPKRYSSSQTVNETSGLLKTGVPLVYPIKSCNFDGITTDTATALISSINVLSIVIIIFSIISASCFLVLLAFKIYKLIISKNPKPTAKSKNNTNKSILGTVYSALGIVLLISDDILSFVFVCYLYSLYQGTTGLGCVICLLQISSCKKNSEFDTIISSSKFLII